MPRVSVIVAAHEAAETLPATLASVAAQTFSDWEVVVCDDASTDATGDAARAALGERVTVVRNEVAQGPGGARNAAVAAATGELLATLDADDLWLPDFLETQVGAYDRATLGRMRVGLVTCDARFESPSGEDRGTWFGAVGRAEPLTLTALLRTNHVFTSVLCPAHVWREAGGQEPSLWIAQDYDLWVRIVEAGWAALVTDRILAVYRVAEGGISANTVRLAADTRAVMQRALERGRLTGEQRRVARRHIRLQELVEARAAIADARHGGHPVLSRRLRLLPRLVRVAAEHPERWAHWLRRGPRDAGPARHA
jgi:glycosyltransferase involved in cell wall biosynthesis